ncbi:hypothetical protein VNO77_20343 [Canavalia gladiata]|uniref:Uncharacterized protein n=1 Tax=Canavalia gladiata TaxID=3824 RepID=A0AAN9QQG6_CANGL
MIALYFALQTEPNRSLSSLVLLRIMEYFYYGEIIVAHQMACCYLRCTESKSLSRSLWLRCCHWFRCGGGVQIPDLLTFAFED